MIQQVRRRKKEDSDELGIQTLKRLGLAALLTSSGAGVAQSAGTGPLLVWSFRQKSLKRHEKEEKRSWLSRNWAAEFETAPAASPSGGTTRPQTASEGREAT